ncbi:MAG TPA: TIGR00269 family protein, partial [Nitrososphaeraceae archaeon]|nr:TIGR00269 family protein [Nitrososphaeraceae archaeon]
FQSEQCPYQDESIRTEIREFFNSLEENRSGIKYNAYNSILKISKILKANDNSLKKRCNNCGYESTGSICSVCNNLKVLN